MKKTKPFHYFRLLFIAALLVIAVGMFPSSVYAGSPVLVLSNYGTGPFGMSLQGYEAVGFTTPASPVYAFTSADLLLSVPGGCTLQAWLYTSSGDVPGSVIMALSVSGATVSAPGGYILSASTSYWIVVTTSCGTSPTWNYGGSAPTGIFTSIGSAFYNTYVGPGPWTLFNNYDQAIYARVVEPEVGLSDTSYDFGNQSVGFTSAAHTFTITNNGLADLHIGSLGTTGDFGLSNDNCSSATVTPGNSCTFDATFTPTAAGSASGSVSIPSDAATSPDGISLSGTGLAAPAVSLSTSSIDFGNQLVGTASANQTVTVTNTGSANLRPTLSTAGGFEFGISNDNCSNATVTPGNSCTFDVYFNPTSLGNKTGWINVISEAASSPDSVSLTGTGVSIPLTGTNLLTTPGFDSSLIFPRVWRPIGFLPHFYSIFVDCSTFISSPCSVAFPGKNRYYAALQRLSLKGLAGDQYLFGLSSSADSVPAGGNYRVEVFFYNRLNRIVGITPLNFTVGSHGWQTLSGIATAPVNYNGIGFRFIFRDPSGKAWFDDAFLIAQ